MKDKIERLLQQLEAKRLDAEQCTDKDTEFYKGRAQALRFAIDLVKIILLDE